MAEEISTVRKNKEIHLEAVAKMQWMYLRNWPDDIYSKVNHKTMYNHWKDTDIFKNLSPECLSQTTTHYHIWLSCFPVTTAAMIEEGVDVAHVISIHVINMIMVVFWCRDGELWNHASFNHTFTGRCWGRLSGSKFTHVALQSKIRETLKMKLMLRCYLRITDIMDVKYLLRKV